MSVGIYPHFAGRKIYLCEIVEESKIRQLYTSVLPVTTQAHNMTNSLILNSEEALTPISGSSKIDFDLDTDVVVSRP
jgi:hypothetical protein